MQLQTTEQSAAWVQEFQALSMQQSPSLIETDTLINGTTAQDALSQTAKVLVDAVAHNQKVSGSQFVQFMRQIRDKEVDLGQETISSSKPPLESLQGAQEWSKELLGSDVTVQSSGWEEDFSMMSNDQALQDRPRVQTLDDATKEATWAQRTLPPPTIGRPDYYQGLPLPHQSPLNPTKTTVQTDWDEAFHSSAAPMDNMDTTETTIPETQQEQVNADDMEQAFRDFYGKGHSEWTQEFQTDLDGMKEQRVEELEQIGQDWAQAHPTTDSNLLHADPSHQSSAYDHYAFTPNNPFLSLPFGKNKDLALSDLEGYSQMTVTEKILRLEAHLQCTPDTGLACTYWIQLGRAQQENENDINAIAALKQGLALDPRQSEAWLLLAASYTNENCKHEACESLFSWLNHHHGQQEEGQAQTRAHGIPIMKRGSLPEKEAFLRKEFAELTGRSSGQRPDPSLQVGWGILCTLGGNFVNAVDCFEAALASRPEVIISCVFFL
jgi:peroxin-5